MINKALLLAGVPAAAAQSTGTQFLGCSAGDEMLRKDDGSETQSCVVGLRHWVEKTVEAKSVNPKTLLGELLQRLRWI